jgi:RHS repeat-associated protein
MTSPEGRTYVETLDKLGHVVTTQLGALEPTQVEYDTFGRVVALTSASRVATLGFDDAGNLVKSIDPLEQLTKFGYDTVGRLIQTTLADSQPIAFGYDANFNLVSVTPPGKEQHGFAFGLGDLLSSYIPPALDKATVATRYEYNADQQLVAVTRPDEGALELVLEKSTGRLTSMSFPEGSVSLEYDPKTGQLSSSTRDKSRVSFAYEGDLPTRAAWAGEVAGSVAHSYDKNFWVISEQVTDRPAISFSYDNDGLLIAAGSETLTRDKAHGFVTDTKLSSITDRMSYSSVGEPRAYAASASGKELLAQAFERDGLGRVSQVTETTAGATHVLEYTYYPRGWLKSVTRDGAEEQSYEYDENGNRTLIKLEGKAATAEFDAQDRLSRQGDVRFDYSLNGELATKEDAAGTTKYTYDTLGNLLSVVQPNVGEVEYVIDPAGRRVGKKLDGKLLKGFLYRSALQPIAELDGAGKVTSVFVYASRPNVPDYLIRGTTTYRIISDLRGSPRLVVNAATGAVAQQLDYDAWGNVTTDTSPGFQPFGFAGGLYDPDTGLVRFGARDYHAATGRWGSKDPSLFRGGLNLYAYTMNDPIDFIDVNGRNPVLVGAVVGGLYGAFSYALTAPTDLCVSGFLRGFGGAVVSGAFAGGVGAAVEGGLLADIVANTAISFASQGLQAAITGKTPGLNEMFAKAVISGATSGVGGAIARNLLPGGALPTIVESSLIAGPAR